jgi:ferric-dicitrate binding protein FerR (iron transport regulator)
MQHYCRMYHKIAVLVLIPILILSGCTAAPTTVQATDDPSQAEVSVVESTAAPTTAQATDDQFQAALTAVEASAWVLGNANTVTEVMQDKTANVQVGDRIDLDEQSRSILNFPDFLEVELFRNSKVLLTDVKQETGGSSDVILNLVQGHMFVRPKTLSGVTVETSYSTITTLEGGTQFDVCQNEILTCVLVKKGSAQVIAQGKREIVKAGEASYILKNQPPALAICAPVKIFVDWEDNYRLAADTSTLSKMISELPQEPCVTQILGLPSEAHILYKDDFKNPSSGWSKEKIDNYSIGYSGGEYYNVEILNPNFKYPVFVPKKPKYEDVNIDLKVVTQAAHDGDFHYGLVFRRSGDQYYAFTISPSTKKWFVLKSTSDALKILKEGRDDGIQGLDNAADTLRVSAKGSTFFFRINGLLVYQISDAEYATGEVGLFVQTRDSSNALIDFDSLTIWNIRAPFIDPPKISNENCFNNKDDDGDHLIDKADPNCLIEDRVETATPRPLITTIPGLITPTDEPITPIVGSTEVTACAPPEEDPGCDPSHPYDPTICDCGAFVPGGCTDPAASNYDPDAPYDDGSCEYLGCTDPAADNYDPNATVDDGSCTYSVPGCTDPAADNYDPNATVDDGSCTYSVPGCTDPAADNYDPNATVDDGSCTYSVPGCTDPAALNYDPNATVDDGSCIYG